MKHSTLHFVLTLLWACLAVPTVLVWKDSILWVALISVYANVVGHWSSWEAAKGKETADKITDK